MMTAILDDLRHFRAGRLKRRSRYREQLDDLPPGLYAYWARSAPGEFKGIGCDALFFARAAEALMEFFDCVAFSGKPCALPSKAADSVWHAWLRFAPGSLHAFCMKHYRRLIPHLEAQAMPGPMDEALATCLVAARRIAGVAPGANWLPALFALDARLKMPHGYGYRMAGHRIGVADLDARGRAMRESFPHSLTAAGLVQSGLIHEWEVPKTPQDAGAGGGGSSDGCDSGDGGDGGSCGGCGGGGGD